MRTPKYRKHSSRDCAFVEWKGRRYYLPGTHGSHESKDAYRRFLRDHHLADPKPKPTRAFTIADLAAQYLAFAEVHYPPGPHSEYAGVRKAIGHVLAKYAALPAKDFGPLKLKEVRQSLVDAGISRKYCNKQTSRIRRMFRWGVSEELVSATVYDALVAVADLQKGRTAAPEREPIRPVEWSDVEPVIAELSPVLADMVRAQWLTGVRSDSLCRAHSEQFDRRESPWTWRPRHKTEYRGSELVVYVGPKAQAVLARYMTGGFLFKPRAQAKNGRYGKHYTSGSYRQAIERAIKRVNLRRAKDKKPPIPDWNPHQLRHSRATIIRAAYGLEAAQASLGHGTADVTQIYAERNLGLARRIAADIG